ncbi:MAG: murein hydrolase activator EnvC family protein [Ruminococcus sp.]
MTKKIIAAILMLSIISFGTIFSVGAAEDIDSLESQLASLKEEDAKYQEILNKTKDDISEKEAYSDALVNKINVLGEQLSLNHNKSDELDTKISQLQKDIDSANEGITTQMETLKSRLKTIYMAGGASDLEIILGAKDFSDFLDKLELVKTLSAYDSNLINEIKEKLKGITENKQELEANKQELKQVEQDLESDQAELQKLLDENQDLLNNLYSESDLLIANIETSSSELSDVERQIQEYYAKQKAEQEAAQQSQSSSENSSQSNSDDNYDDDEPSNGSSGGSSGSSSGDSGYTPPSSSGGYVWPCPGFYYLSSEWNEDRYTYNHGAIDIAGGGIMGATVVAADSGTVISSNSSCVHNWGKSGSCGCGGGYGNYVWIDHGNGKATVYAHLSSVSVSTGQYVSQGQVLGYVGSTGESTGPHLHFECRYYGEKYNPMTEF